jgi:hypothetical protein
VLIHIPTTYFRIKVILWYCFVSVMRILIKPFVQCKVFYV